MVLKAALLRSSSHLIGAGENLFNEQFLEFTGLPPHPVYPFSVIPVAT